MVASVWSRTMVASVWNRTMVASVWSRTMVASVWSRTMVASVWSRTIQALVGELTHVFSLKAEHFWVGEPVQRMKKRRDLINSTGPSDETC